MLNIILRTHNRPIKFKRMLDCIQKQSFQNFNLYITADNDETESYVKQYSLPYIRMFPDTTIPVFYNLYFNDIYQKIDNGWIWGIDDDDLLADDNVFQFINDTCILEDKIYIFKFHNKHARCIRPGRNFGKKIEIGDIGTANFVVNRKYCCDVLWGANGISDGIYISNVAKNREICWIDKVIYVVEKANHGT